METKSIFFNYLISSFACWLATLSSECHHVLHLQLPTAALLHSLALLSLGPYLLALYLPASRTEPWPWPRPPAWQPACSHLRVHGLVLLQADGMAEGLATHVTGKGPRATVWAAHMYLKAVRCGEDLKKENTQCQTQGERAGGQSYPVWEKGIPTLLHLTHL